MATQGFLSSSARALSKTCASSSMTFPRTAALRSFQTSARRLETVVTPAAPTVTLPARKPVGAFRGGFFGFLLGSTLAGGGVYTYVMQEYKAANDLLTEDIYALQAATHRMSLYLGTLEEKIDTMERKK